MPVHHAGRRMVVAIFSLALVTSLLGWGLSVQGQVKKPLRPPVMVAQPALPLPAPAPGPNGNTAAQFSAIKLEEKSEYRQVVNFARDCINDKNWPDACKALQNILDTKENFYVRIRERDAHGKETLRWTSIKFEAINLLGTLPDEALEVYELNSGAQAKDKLDEAKRTGDVELLKDVAQTYMYTKAGIEANDLLATYFLDRGQFFMAALRLEKLLAMNPERTKLSDLTLFKAALAYRRAGDGKHSDEAFKRLEPHLREVGGLKINGEVVPVAKLIEVLGEKAPAPLFNDWPSVRGNDTNSAQAVGSQPLLDPADILATRLLVQDKEEGGGAAGQIAADRLRAAVEQQRALNNTPVMSGSFPIAANKLAIYRTYRDLRAVYLFNGKDILGQDAQVGKIFWQTRDFDGSLTPLMENSRHRSVVEGWLQQYNQSPGFRSLLFENSLIGTISTDHRLVYAVDDLAVPPPGNMMNFVFNQPNMSPEMRTLLMQNSLYAVNINTGKFEWRLGVGKTDEQFGDSHFLGVPISVGGKLWVLNEKHFGQNSGQTGDAELRLVCIDPNKMPNPSRPLVVAIEKLGLVQQQHRFTHDVSRRTNAVHLAYADGILVCPTNAGEVLGVDILSRSLAWSYPYREQATNATMGPNPFQPVPFPIRPGFPQPMNLSPAYWKSAPPVVQNGKVVFTAPDATSVHCINLRDGTPIWKKKQMDGDLYFAGVFQGKALIVGRNCIRALNLEDGAQVWSVPTGALPSGQGVACKNIYYQPLQKGELLAVDIERGNIKAHNRAKSAPPDLDPGNLLFYEGVVLSQTPTQLVIYPQLTSKLELVTKQLEKEPNNLEKLITRGELLFADGQVQAAVDCLQLALHKDLGAELKIRAQQKLYEALTDLLQTDFKTAGKKYMKEYFELCKAENENERQQRLAKYYRIVGQGYESMHDLVNAFQMYREFGELPINRKDGVASVEDPMHKVPTNVWLRGRIAGMMARATPEQRLPLENKIAEEWKLVKAKKDNLNAIRIFVDMFDVPFAVGREARLYLAEAIIDRNERDAFLEAELNLQQLRGSDYFADVPLSAGAVAALAKLEEKKGSADAMKLAAAYYRELRRDFPRVPLADDKTTGEVLFDALTTDPRFLPYLEEQGPLWSREKISAREVQNYSGGMPGFVFQPEGDLNPLMKQHRLVLDLNSGANPLLRLYNFGNGTTRWTVNLGVNNGANHFMYFQYLYQQGQNNVGYYPNARFRFYQVRGNLAVLQVGTVAYGLDMDVGRVLWQQNLVDNLPVSQPGMNIQQVQPDAEGNLQIVVWNQFNGQRSTITIGHVGAVQASYVALLTQKGLTVVDPLKGLTLWQKLDVPVRARVFGDDQYLFLLEQDEGGAVGAGRVLRAIDGATVLAPDFSGVYQGKIRIMGRKILAAVPGANKVTLKLYDIVAGKDLWSKEFNAKAEGVLATEDPALTGVIEANGQMTVLDVDSGRVLVKTSVLQGNVGVDDVANLQEPLLLRDRERYYLALNQPLDVNKVQRNAVFNSFQNGLRCRPVNGWLLAFFREDGQHLENGKPVAHKRGEFQWAASKKLENQMIVLEQFENLPVIVVSSRYNELINAGAGGSRWLSATKAFARGTGKMIYGPEARGTAGVGGTYSTFSVDPKERTINLISAGQGMPTVQFYVDDGSAPKNGPAGTVPGTGALRSNAPSATVALPAPAGFGAGMGGVPVPLPPPLPPPPPPGR